MLCWKRFPVRLALLLALGACAQTALAQDGAQPTQQASDPRPAADAPPDPSVDIPEMTVPLQEYKDPDGRFAFAAPAQWGRLPSKSHDEVLFQNATGDSLRVSIDPLTVDRDAFMRAYVDTYLAVLAQSFSEPRFLGQRQVTLGTCEATDFNFAAMYHTAPVLCHQVVLLETDKVLYITFAGFGSARENSEQLFMTALLTFWVNPSFGGAVRATTGTVDPNAPAFILPIPEGWTEQPQGDGNSHMFGPPEARPTSAFISTRVAKPPASDDFKDIDAFAAAYTERLKSRYPDGTFELYQTRKIFLGGEPAVRFDYGYISNYGVRKSVLVLCNRKGYVVGVNCDAAEQGYSTYEKAFENLVTSFKFK